MLNRAVEYRRKLLFGCRINKTDYLIIKRLQRSDASSPQIRKELKHIDDQKVSQSLRWLEKNGVISATRARVIISRRFTVHNYKTYEGLANSFMHKLLVIGEIPPFENLMDRRRGRSTFTKHDVIAAVEKTKYHRSGPTLSSICRHMKYGDATVKRLITRTYREVTLDMLTELVNEGVLSKTITERSRKKPIAYYELIKYSHAYSQGNDTNQIDGARDHEHG